MKMEENIDQFKEELDLMSKQQNNKNPSKILDDGPKIRRNEELSKNKKKHQWFIVSLSVWSFPIRCYKVRL